MTYAEMTIEQKIAHHTAQLAAMTTENDKNFHQKKIKSLKAQAKKAAAPQTVTVVCQWTGVQFEATSKRFKTHPEMAKTESWTGNKRQRYADAVRAAGGSFDAPEVVAVREALITEMEQEDAGQLQRENKIRKLQKDRQYAREARRQQNALLRKHGYQWIRSEYSEGVWEDMCEPNASWTLVDSNNKPVSLADALATINAK